MATRTLGIRFEVAGVKEARESFRQLKQGLNDSLANNKKAVKDSANLNQAVVKSQRQSNNSYQFDGDYVNNYRQTYRALRESRYRDAFNTYSRPRFNTFNQSFNEGIGNEFGRRFASNLDSTFRKVFGLKQYREEIDISKESADNIGYAVARYLSGGKQDYRNQRDKNLNKPIKLSQNKGIFKTLLDGALMPIKTIQYSFFEGIGSTFGGQYAQGMSKVLEEDLDLSFERRGMVGGKAISYTATEGIGSFFDSLKQVTDKATQLQENLRSGNLTGLHQQIESLYKQTIKTLTILPSKYLAGFRRGSVEIESLRKIQEEVDNTDSPDLTGKKTAVLTISGFGGTDNGEGGYKMADSLRQFTTEDTAVIGVENKFTDLDVSFEKPLQWLIQAVSKLTNINLKGYNPDSIKLAAKAIKILQSNPEIKLKIVGHSAGGFVAEEAQHLLNLLGFGERVDNYVVGTPNLAGNLDVNNAQKIMGDNDFRIKPLEQASEYLGLGEQTGQEVAGVEDHFWDNYLESRDFLKTVLGDSFDESKFKEQEKRASEFKGNLIELQTAYLNYLKQINHQIESIKQSVEKATNPSEIIGSKVAEFRRDRLKTEGQQKLEETLKNQDYDEIKVRDNVEQVVAVIGGFAGNKGQSGQHFANKISGIVKDDKVQYVGLSNEFTDVIDTREAYGGTKEGLEKSVLKIGQMFAEAQKLGYNPDAIKGAAEIIKLQQQNPNLKIKVAGYSGGGYVAEDLITLLSDYGANMNNIEVMGVGTPELPGGIKTKDFKKVLGKDDPIFQVNKIKEINEKLKNVFGFDLLPGLTQKIQNIEGIDSHALDQYIFLSEEVQKFLYGDNQKIVELAQVYQEVNRANKISQDIAQKIQQVQKSDLPTNIKLEQIRGLQEYYVNLLNSIVELSQYAKSQGGGKYFTRLEQQSRRYLRDLNPPQQRTNNQPVRTTRESQLSETARQFDPIPDPWQQPAFDKQALKKQYQSFLNNLIENAQQDTNETVAIVAKDFKNLDRDSQQSYLQQMRTAFNIKARLFRDAVKNGQLEIAKDQGEKLLKLSALLKNLYRQLDSDGEIDRQVTAKMRGLTRYVTSVQNEVIRGSQAKGRSPEGLTGVFSQQLDLLENQGTNVNRGFVDGILADLASVRQAGEQIGDAVTEGVEDNLEIQSPSKVFQRLGRWVVEGFRQGLAGLEDRGREVVREAGEGIKEEIEKAFDADNIGRLVDTGGAEIIKKLGGLIFNAAQNEGFDNTINLIADLSGKLIRLVLAFKLLKVALDAFGLTRFVEAFRNLPEAALDAANAVEVLDKRIVDMSGSAIKGAQNLEFISNKAKQLEKDLTNAKENYSQLLSATRETSLEGFQTENIYSAFATIAKQKGLSSAQEQNLFRSIRSIIGKQYLSQEEVRQEIGELLGDFPNLLAASQGVSVPQLNKMIENRQVTATDALPKVAAYILAQNAIAPSADTGAAAVNRLDNAIVRFRESVGFALQPIQKVGNNFLAGFFNELAEKINTLQSLIHGFFLTLFVNLLRLQIFGQSVQKLLLGLIKVLWSFKGAIFKFGAEIILLSAAIGTLQNIWKLLNNSFPESERNIEILTQSLYELRQALADVGKETEGLNLPISTKDLELNEGAKVPEGLQGFAGGDRWNFDNFIRKRYNNYSQWVQKITGQEPLPDELLITTQAEKKRQDFIGNVSQIQSLANQVRNSGNQFEGLGEDINKLDEEVRQIQSESLELLSGDRIGLEASLEKERAVLEKRNELIKPLATYQQTLDASIQVVSSEIERYNELAATKGLTAGDSQILEGLNLTLDELKDKKNDIDKTLSRFSDSLSEFEREVRNANERIKGFIENRARQAQQQRTEVIEQGLAEGAGERTIQLRVEEVNRDELTDYIAELETEIKNSLKRLNSGALAEGYRLVQQSAQDNNLTLNSTTIERMLQEERTTGEKRALEELKVLRETEGQLYQYQEQLAQNLQNNRSTTIDFVRTINDFFFRLNQQFQEAQIEVQRALIQLINNRVKLRLRSAIVPGSESFVNGIIEGIQGILDQGASLLERALGQKSARIQFQATEYNLQQELQDFARQVNLAGDALVKFQNKLNGNSSASTESQGDTPLQTSPNPLPSSVIPVPGLPSFGTSGTLPPPPNVPGIDFNGDLVKQATELTERTVRKQEQNLDIQDANLKTEEELLKLQREQLESADKRKLQFEDRESRRAADLSVEKALDLDSQYGFSTAQTELEKNIRSLGNQYVDYDRELFTQIQKYQDTVNAAIQFNLQAPGAIKLLRASGRNEDADLLQKYADRLSSIIDPYSQLVNDLTSVQDNLVAQAEKSLQFLREQGELRVNLEQSQRRSELLQLKQNIAQQRGTVESDRQLKIELERERLRQRIDQLQIERAGDDNLFDLIQAEREASSLNEQNIDYDARSRELELEKRLLDLDASIKQQKASSLNALGLNLQGDRISKQSAIASENVRFRQELLQLQKEFAGQPELLDEFVAKAKELNRVNLEAINQQFKTLGRTIQQTALSATQNFFSNAFTNLFDYSTQRNRAELEERLRYAEQINQLENQYRDDPNRLADMKNRARELNEEKLDKIRNEFNLLRQVIEFGRQALLSFIQELARMAAQQVAGRLFKSFMGSFGGGGGSAGGFVGDAITTGFASSGGSVTEEGLVPNYAVGGNITRRKVAPNIANFLKNNFPGVAQAFSAEGEGARLGVFHVGEELLSRKTGEAQAYQRLKYKLGIDPLQKLENFADGGTVGYDIERNILSSFPRGDRKVDLSSISRGQSKPVSSSKSVTINQTIQTPNSDSFRANSTQRNQDLIESIRRGF